MVAQHQTGWPRRGNCIGRHRYRGRLHGRHRRHHHLRLGDGTGRPGAGGRRRGRWLDTGPALGLRASWPAGAGAADRPRARRDRRDHPAAGRVHAGAFRRDAAGATRQGLDRHARCPGGRGHAALAHRARRGPAGVWPCRLARRCLRHRRGAGHRQCPDPAASEQSAGRDRVADRGGNAAGAGGFGRGGPVDVRAVGGRPGGSTARDRPHRRSVAKRDACRAPDLVSPVRRRRAHRGRRRVRRSGGRTFAAGDGGGGRRGRAWQRRRALVGARVRRRRSALLPRLRATRDADHCDPGNDGRRRLDA